MVALLLIAAGCLLVLLAWCAFEPRLQARREARPKPCAGATAPPTRYLHPGHAWATLHTRCSAVLGVADLAPRLLGRVEAVELPRDGDHVVQGEPFCTLRRGRRAIRLPAPISGLVTEVNRELIERPALVNESPYEEGWAVRVMPEHCRPEVENLLRGPMAALWQDAARAELARWFAPAAGMAMPDGGLPVEDLSDRLGDEEWERLVKTFFPEEEPEDLPEEHRETGA